MASILNPRGGPSFLPVANMPRRARAIVVGLDADPATQERMAALGLGIGASFTVVAPGAQPTVQVGESRIGLGKELASALRAVPCGRAVPAR